MKFKNWFWGLFFIAAAGLIIVNQLGYMTGISLLSLIITIFMIPIIIKSCMHLNFAGILFPIAILCILYAGPLGITSLVPWPVLIVALFGSIGLTLIFSGSEYYRNHIHFIHHEHFEEIVDSPDSENINFKTHLSSSIKYVNTDNFTKGIFSCSLGALKVYFDNAKLNENGAEIYLDISLSGVELYMPKSWKVVNKANVSLSGIEEKNHPNPDANSPVVTLTGNVSLSGIEIIYV